MGNVLDLARKDAQKIVSSFGYETQITFTKGLVSALVTGLGIIHHLSFDTSGQMVSSKNAHLCVHENTLIEAGVTVRNTNNEVYLKDWIVSFADSTGTVKKYCIKENYSDETIGIITLNLGKYVD
jgi:hypothetical protein